MTEELNVETVEQAFQIFKSLSSKTRFDICLALNKGNQMFISEIADLLEQTEANVSAQVIILIKAGVLKYKYEKGSHGVKKMVTIAKPILKIDFDNIEVEDS